MSGEMTERDIEQLRDLCRRAEPYMRQRNNDAECRYDDETGLYHMDAFQYLVMQGTRAWLDQWMELQE